MEILPPANLQHIIPKNLNRASSPDNDSYNTMPTRSLHPRRKSSPKVKWLLKVCREPNRSIWFYYCDDAMFGRPPKEYRLTYIDSAAMNFKTMKKARNMGAHLIRENLAYAVEIIKMLGY